jgi:hypothetical protein
VTSVEGGVVGSAGYEEIVGTTYSGMNKRTFTFVFINSHAKYTVVRKESLLVPERYGFFFSWRRGFMLWEHA